MRAIHHILMLMTGRSLDFFIPEWAKRNRNDYYGENLMKLQIPETMDTVGLLRFASCLISFYGCSFSPSTPLFQLQAF